eukprot:6207371-Pleurochrysis_carterae.AAC.2
MQMQMQMQPKLEAHAKTQLPHRSLAPPVGAVAMAPALAQPQQYMGAPSRKGGPRPATQPHANAQAAQAMPMPCQASGWSQARLGTRLIGVAYMHMLGAGGMTPTKTLL